MKKICFTFAFFALLAIVITSCGKTEDATPNPVKIETTQQVEDQTPQGFELEATENITMNHDMMEKFRASDDFKSLDAAQIDWDQLVLATYKDTDMKAIIVSFLAPSTKVLYAPYVNQEFKSIVMEFESTATVSANTTDQAFTGNLNFYKPDGTQIVSASYAENQFLGAQTFGLERGYWSCVGSCLSNVYQNSSWWIQLVCGSAFGGCAFGANPAACIALSGCLGGYLGWCIGSCI
ncbi:MAG: hypothetical protein AB8G15_18190 [Saprospiraceae bacterium]